MKIALSSDHRGIKLKGALADFLKAKGYEVFDFGISIVIARKEDKEIIFMINFKRLS